MKPLQPGRIRCAVPGCGRTCKSAIDEVVICGKHWRLADKWQRRRLTKIRRIYMRLPPGSNAQRRAGDLWWKTWDRCVAQAIERSLGL